MEINAKSICSAIFFHKVFSSHFRELVANRGYPFSWPGFRDVAYQLCYYSSRRLSLFGFPAMVVFRLCPYRGFGQAAFSLSLLLCLTVLVLNPYAASQSVDDVHIVPRHGPDKAGSEATVIPAEGLPTLDAHTKPLRAAVDLVLVPVVVTDTMNRPVMGLNKKDFTLYEGNEQQQIKFFSAEDVPISVGLILDFSKSMTNKIDTERAAVAEFFKNAHPADDYFVTTVSSRPREIATSADSIDTIESTLASTMPDGSTALLDAVYLALSSMRSAKYQRRALLIISDGADNSSRYRLKEIKSIVQEADVDIYAIGIFDTALFKTYEEYMGKKWLGEITDATAGRTITVDDLARLPEVAGAISRELRNQYVLGYQSSNGARDGKWRKIKVRVTPPASTAPVHAHYKKGYIAPES